MFKKKFILSISFFIIFSVFTSVIKNKTRVIEKHISNLSMSISSKEKNINEAQLEFFYLTSPAELEKKIIEIGFNDYQPIKFSKIFFNVSDFTDIHNKISNLKKPK